MSVSFEDAKHFATSVAGNIMRRMSIRFTTQSFALLYCTAILIAIAGCGQITVPSSESMLDEPNSTPSAQASSKPTSTPTTSPTTTPTVPPQSWQSKLEKRFHVVETFDELQDWDGSAVPIGYSWSTTSPSTLPKQLNGLPSRWSYTTTSNKAIEISNLSGTFTRLDIVTGGVSGAKGGVASARYEGGKHYLVFGYGAGTNSIAFQPNETITNGNGASATVVRYVKWIGDHGVNNAWRGPGKSLCINYGDFTSGGNISVEYPDNVAGFGPSRLGTFFGDGITGRSGYKKIHIFMMAKLAPNFVKKDPATGKYIYIGTVKMFDLVSGFVAPDKWGTPSEAATVSPNVNNINEYGLNFYIFNLFGTGSYGERFFFSENAYTALYKTTGNPGWTMNQLVSNRPLTETTTFNNAVSGFYEAGEWFGIEIAADIGTIGANDATLEFWVYDKNGLEKGRFSESGNNRLLQFDHRYNKVVLGGNRICSGYGSCPAGQDNRWYIDDFIIHDSRIGSTYFRLLAE